MGGIGKECDGNFKILTSKGDIMRNALISIIFLFLCCTGCFNLYTINLLKTDANSNEISNIDKNNQIELNFYCPSCIGCYLSRTRDIDNNKQYSCKGVFILDSTNAKGQLSQLAFKDTSATTNGYLFTKFCEILESSLTLELKKSFKDVKVNIVENDSAMETIVPEFSYVSGMTRFSKNTAKVVLTATSSKGMVIKAEAINSDNISAGHLGWAIPVSILTYPIGSLITVTAFQSMSISQINTLIIRSINQASSELVKKMFKASSESGASKWFVKIEISSC